MYLVWHDICHTSLPLRNRTDFRLSHFLNDWTRGTDRLVLTSLSLSLTFYLFPPCQPLSPPPSFLVCLDVEGTFVDTCILSHSCISCIFSLETFLRVYLGSFSSWVADDVSSVVVNSWPIFSSQVVSSPGVTIDGPFMVTGERKKRGRGRVPPRSGVLRPFLTPLKWSHGQVREGGRGCRPQFPFLPTWIEEG